MMVRLEKKTALKTALVQVLWKADPNMVLDFFARDLLEGTPAWTRDWSRRAHSCKKPGKKKKEILTQIVRREWCYHHCLSKEENEVLRDFSKVIWVQNQNQHSAAQDLNSLCEPAQGSTRQPDQLTACPSVPPLPPGYGDYWAIIWPLAPRALSK